MRLHPTVTLEEALDWLKSQAITTLGADPTPELDEALKPLAEAMAAISATVLPDEMEPMFP